VEQLGHEDPAFTFRVYQRAVKRRDKLSGTLLEEFDRGLEWAEIGRIAETEQPEARYWKWRSAAPRDN
jgi:hypothetical protein